MSSIVIVGAGHGGIALADALRSGGSTDQVTLVGGEAELPYERPPLSKEVLAGQSTVELIRLRSAAWYAHHDVELLLRTRVGTVDRATRTIRLEDGRALAYDQLVLATGGTPRSLAVGDVAGVGPLAEPHHCEELRARIDVTADVVIVGAGQIGLEVASAAVAAGRRPVVLELADRVLARVAAPAISAAVAAHHRASGVALRLGTGVDDIRQSGGQVTGVVTTEGEVVPAGLVIVGIGSRAVDGLAQQAGLPCDDGVLVHASLQTPDPAIWAIGDCARFPRAGRAARLESVQSAVDQARHVAAQLVGTLPLGTPYDAVPWFWSTQGALRLQSTGFAEGGEQDVLRGDPATGRFSVFRFQGDRLTCVDSFNHAPGHLAGRRLLATSARLTPEQVADPRTDLQSLVPAP